jgi:4-amino-4-deoxy-L-arabinose transferase-like glycosyltransferase
MEISDKIKLNTEIHRTTALLCLTAVWAMIYLPLLGTDEISTNEVRRVIPAIEMIKTGNWSTSYFAGEAYYAKPPLMNWLIAASFMLAGEYNAFTGRLPTTIVVLLTSWAFMLLPKTLLSRTGRFFAGAMFLTTFGMTSSGRTANIDAVYVCFTGLALIFWLRGWGESQKGFWLWIPAGAMLGAGLLLKGPLILLFFYISVVAILTCSREKKRLAEPYHFLGITLMLGIFLIWMYFSRRQSPAQQSSTAESVWINEMAMRFDLNAIGFSKWFTRVTGSIAQFMPWLLFIPLLWKAVKNDSLNDKQLYFLRAAHWMLPIPFILINAMPLTKARYCLPLLPSYCIATAIVLPCLSGLILTRWREVLKWAAQIFIPAGILVILGAVWLVALPEVLPQKVKQAAFYPGLIFLAGSSILILGLSAKRWPKIHGSLAGIMSVSVLLLAAGIFTGISIGSPLDQKKYGRDLAARINHAVPEGETLYVLGPVGTESFVFYLKRPVQFIAKPDQLENNVNYVLTNDRDNAGLDTAATNSKKWIIITSLTNAKDGHVFSVCKLE